MELAANYAKNKAFGKVSNKLNKERDIEDGYMMLNPDEKKILDKVKRRAARMDTGFNCGLFRFGYDAFLGMLPIAGDVLTTGYALCLIRTACQADLPKSVVFRMMMNVGIDFFIGLTPVAGDILDVLFKCNTQNAKLLEDVLIKRRKEQFELERGDKVPVSKSLLSLPKSVRLNPQIFPLPTSNQSDTENKRGIFRYK